MPAKNESQIYVTMKIFNEIPYDQHVNAKERKESDCIVMASVKS